MTWSPAVPPRKPSPDPQIASRSYRARHSTSYFLLHLHSHPSLWRCVCDMLLAVSSIDFHKRRTLRSQALLLHRGPSMRRLCLLPFVWLLGCVIMMVRDSRAAILLRAIRPTFSSV